MSKPKLGCRARIRESALQVVNSFYGAKFRADDTFEVVHIDAAAARGGRSAVLLKAPGRDEPLMLLWRNQINPLQRCKYCDDETHGSRRCTTTAKEEEL